MSRSQRVVEHPIYEGVMATLAVAAVALLFAGDAPWTRPVQLVVWLIFVVDYIVRLAMADDRMRFVRGNLIDLVAIMPADALRLARVARLARLARVGSWLWRTRRSWLGVLRTNGSGAAVMSATGVILGGAAIVWAADPGFETYGDSVWWAVVTATTVGYGDLAPQTTASRVVAAIIMLVGIGTVGLLTASIATYFSEPGPGLTGPGGQATAVVLSDGTTVELDEDRARLVEALLRATR